MPRVAARKLCCGGEAARVCPEPRTEAAAVLEPVWNVWTGIKAELPNSVSGKRSFRSRVKTQFCPPDASGSFWKKVQLMN